MRRKRGAFTLLEALVAFSILSGVLALLFSFFWQLQKGTQLNEVENQHLSQERYVESRLFFLFSRVLNENKSSQAKQFRFHTLPRQPGFSSSPILFFTFDHGVRLPPSLSGPVLAGLYIDEAKNLCLCIWPMHTLVEEAFEQVSYREILLTGADELHFVFFAAPLKDLSTPSFEEAQPLRGRWNEEEWLPTWEEMPSMVKMQLRYDRDREIEWTFVLPTSQNYIYYPPDNNESMYDATQTDSPSDKSRDSFR